MSLVLITVAVVLFIAIILVIITALYWKKTKKVIAGNIPKEGTLQGVHILKYKHIFCYHFKVFTIVLLNVLSVAN